MSEPRIPPGHRLIALPDFASDNGSVLVAQAHAHVPFDIRRVFVLHNLAEGAVRGCHAHREQHQLLFMVAGRCDVVVDNGFSRTSVLLDRPTLALHAPPMSWLELSGFSPIAVCVVLTSGDYDEADYVRSRDEFERLARG